MVQRVKLVDRFASHLLHKLSVLVAEKTDYASPVD